MLKEAETRLLIGDEMHKILVQFNSARIRSSAAKVDARSIRERPCFCVREICPKNKGE
jgi:hypothetical protein